MGRSKKKIAAKKQAPSKKRDVNSRLTGVRKRSKNARHVKPNYKQSHAVGTRRSSEFVTYSQDNRLFYDLYVKSEPYASSQNTRTVTKLKERSSRSTNKNSHPMTKKRQTSKLLKPELTKRAKREASLNASVKLNMMCHSSPRKNSCTSSKTPTRNRDAVVSKTSNRPRVSKKNLISEKLKRELGADFLQFATHGKRLANLNATALINAVTVDKNDRRTSRTRLAQDRRCSEETIPCIHDADDSVVISTGKSDDSGTEPMQLSPEDNKPVVRRVRSTGKSVRHLKSRVSQSTKQSSRVVSHHVESTEVAVNTPVTNTSIESYEAEKFVPFGREQYGFQKITQQFIRINANLDASPSVEQLHSIQTNPLSSVCFMNASNSNFANGISLPLINPFPTPAISCASAVSLSLTPTPPVQPLSLASPVLPFPQWSPWGPHFHPNIVLSNSVQHASQSNLFCPMFSYCAQPPVACIPPLPPTWNNLQTISCITPFHTTTQSHYPCPSAISPTAMYPPPTTALPLYVPMALGDYCRSPYHPHFDSLPAPSLAPLTQSVDSSNSHASAATTLEPAPCDSVPFENKTLSTCSTKPMATSGRKRCLPTSSFDSPADPDCIDPKSKAISTLPRPSSRVECVDEAPKAPQRTLSTPEATLGCAPSRNEQTCPSENWSWEGEGVLKQVFIRSEGSPVRRMCYRAIRHCRDGMLISVKDNVLLCSGPDRCSPPHVAKITALFEEAGSREKMMALLWYYRPEHIPGVQSHLYVPNELFASRHCDTNPVDCIEDKAFVLTANAFARFMAMLKYRQTAHPRPPLNRAVPPCQSHSSEATPEEQLLHTVGDMGEPPSTVPLSNVFLCRAVYDYRMKRICKNLSFHTLFSSSHSAVQSPSQLKPPQSEHSSFLTDQHSTKLSSTSFNHDRTPCQSSPVSSTPCSFPTEPLTFKRRLAESSPHPCPNQPDTISESTHGVMDPRLKSTETLMSPSSFNSVVTCSSTSPFTASVMIPHSDQNSRPIVTDPVTSTTASSWVPNGVLSSSVLLETSADLSVNWGEHGEQIALSLDCRPATNETTSHASSPHPSTASVTANKQAAPCGNSIGSSVPASSSQCCSEPNSPRLIVL